ncbi:MAG: hypothetical protein KDE68_08475 [Rhodocyclaceae bacterium]|nr:hypothetical protein [Rhodocyclaceae bacterium]
MKLVVAIISLVIAAVVVPMLFMPAPEALVEQQQRLPWNIEALPDGNSRVFGLTLNQSTLADLKAAFGPDVEIAIVGTRSEAGALEAYVASAHAGFITGKLVATAAIDADQLAGMLSRAAKREFMESTTVKSTLSAADLATALTLPIQALSFIPTVNLDLDAVTTRFGAPARQIAANDHQTHLLYPAKGLDVIVDSEGKELLQYVAPRDFDRLSGPLEAAPQ